MHRSLLSFLAIFVALFAASITGSAQHYEGCFVNGQRVPDSVCRGGTSSSSSGSVGCNLICQGMKALFSIPGKLLETPTTSAPQRPVNPQFDAAVQLNSEGVKLSNEKNPRAAAEKFRQALELQPENVLFASNYHDMLASIYESEHKYDAAVAETREALKDKREVLRMWSSPSASQYDFMRKNAVEMQHSIEN